ncbi:MAG: hypothetical protein SVW57_08390 [Thermodesulfobacteriota bacterium]|nr:hypothetical protein [Thermodesulfobacteriota bacterium]
MKGTIKLIGKRAGNSSYEVNIFQKAYDIPFSLFPDKDFSIHKAIEVVWTLCFIGISITVECVYKVFITTW